MDELSTELLDAPDTARAIAIRHRRLNRSRKVPSFKLVSYSKVMNAFYSELRSGMSPRAVNRVLETCLFLFLDLQKQFREWRKRIAPRIADFTRLVDEKFYGKGVWFSGEMEFLFLSFQGIALGESLGTRESYKHILLKQIEQDAQRRSQIIQLAKKLIKLLMMNFVKWQMSDSQHYLIEVSKYILVVKLTKWIVEVFLFSSLDEWSNVRVRKSIAGTTFKEFGDYK